ncbi:MAG: hypothetical protein JWM74_4407, partial [Myxococcaceae bacterium]|nr:hypothetical protein [Myxococcaceae bacterium]
MAAAFRAIGAGGGTTLTADRSASLAVQLGDLLVVFCAASANTNAAPTCTDDLGGTYTLIKTALWSVSANTLSAFVRNAIIDRTATVTVTVATGSNDAAQISITAITGMTRVGAGAVRQSAAGVNGASAASPTASFPAVCLTANLTIVAVGSGDTTTTPPASWTERNDSSQATPTVALETATRASGFTSTAVTWGATQSTVWGAIVIELDGTLGAVNGAATNTIETAFTDDGIDRDAAKGYFFPGSKAQWARFYPALGAPDFIYPLQGTTKPAAGTEIIRGGVGIDTVVDVGATVNTALTGYTRKGIDSAEITGNTALSSTSLPDPHAESMLVLLVTSINTSPGSNDESVLTFGAGSGGVVVTLDHTAPSVVQLFLRVNNVNAGGVAGGAAVLTEGAANQHPIWVQYRRDTSDVALMSDVELIQGTWADVATGTTLWTGGNGSDPGAAITSCYMAIWRGTRAQVARAVIKGATQKMGFTVTGWTAAAHGDASNTIADFTVSAAGTISSSGVHGDASNTLDAFTMSATGTIKIQGNASNTVADATSSATGTIKIAGAASNTLDDFTLTATGKVLVHGAASNTTDDATVSAAGKVLVHGSASNTTDDATVTATGTVEIKGSASITLDDFTSTAAGTIKIVGNATNAVDDFTVSATGKIGIVGNASNTLDDATLTASGSVPATGSASNTLDDFTISATGTVRIVGDADIDLDDATSSASG